MTWSLRYTSHLGYEPPALRPQFLETVGIADYRAHIAYAAEIGMAGVLYPWALARSLEEQTLVRDCLRDAGLACSCVVALPFELVTTPIWADRSVAGRKRLADEIERSAKLAAWLGSDVLAALIAMDPDRTAEQQQADVAANLRDVAAIAGDHGVTIGIEPMKALPGMLLQTTRETIDLIRVANHPRVAMIFDTGHIHSMDGEIVEPFQQAFDHVCLLQLVDQPGRVEPGGGELDLVAVAAHAIGKGYTGLVDLEHGWLSLTSIGEAEGLRRVRQLDKSIAVAAGQ